jgi:hypothetical protein
MHSVIIHRWPQNAAAVRAWVQKVNDDNDLRVTWRGESIATSAVKVLKAFLLKRERVIPTADQMDRICRQQDGRCAACGGICEKDDRQFDHIIPLRDSTEQKFQMLCLGCHSEKTRLEPRCARDPLASCFSRATYEAYVDSAPLPPLAMSELHTPQTRLKDIAEVDVIRCRRNALAYSAHPFLLFCALDTIRPFDTPGLHDLQWIDAGPGGKLFELVFGLV